MKGPGKARFETIFQTGKRVSGQTGRLLAIPGSGMIGVATSKKLGCHAARNRVKRRGREAARAALHQLDGRLDYVLTLGERAEKTGFKDLCADVETMIVAMKERWASELASS